MCSMPAAASAGRLPSGIWPTPFVGMLGSVPPTVRNVFVQLIFRDFCLGCGSAGHHLSSCPHMRSDMGRNIAAEIATRYAAWALAQELLAFAGVRDTAAYVKLAGRRWHAGRRPWKDILLFCSATGRRHPFFASSGPRVQRQPTDGRPAAASAAAPPKPKPVPPPLPPSLGVVYSGAPGPHTAAPIVPPSAVAILAPSARTHSCRRPRLPRARIRICAVCFPHRPPSRSQSSFVGVTLMMS